MFSVKKRQHVNSPTLRTHRLIVKLLFLFLLTTLALSACHEKEEHLSLSLDSISQISDESMLVSEESLREAIHHMVMADSDRDIAAMQTRRHYLNGGAIRWMTRDGVSAKADSLVAYLERVEQVGISPKLFYASQIKDDLERVRSLNFGEGKNSVSRVYGRLEYLLTKAFLRYTEGQRFGFVNPREVLNRLDVRDSDSVRTTYRQLYDVPTKRPGKDYVALAFSVMGSDDASVAKFLRESEPKNPLYATLVRHLSDPLSKADLQRLQTNIERSRWDHGDYPQNHSKYVLINIPSVHLLAVDGEERMTMRIGIGSLKTKTPLLNSRVKRMDFNPQWVIPKSIVKTSIRHHAGSRAYFDSHNYFIINRNTGKQVDPSTVSADMLMSKDYGVVQRGGVGNALGRVVFRFDNNFSIYMHDTSNPGVFSQRDRSVSHGCIRVARPYDLAVFMLSKKDEAMMERMRYSMTIDYRPSHTRGNDEESEKQKESIDKKKMLGSLNVNPQVPIFISYYTLYPDQNGTLVPYPDVYGYDNVIYNSLKGYLASGQ